MRNVSCMGLCWVATFGLVAVSLAQQPERVWRNAPPSAPQTIDTTGMPNEQQPAQVQTGAGLLQGTFVPAASGNNVQPNGANAKNNIAGQFELPAPGMSDEQRRGELGVW